MTDASHVDTVFEWAGYRVGAAFHDALWTGLYLALPAGIWAGGLVWAACRGMREQDYQHVPLYIAYSLAVIWLIWPEKYSFGTVVQRGQARQVEIRVPRALGWFAGLADGLVARIVPEITASMREDTRDFVRLAAIAENERIHDPGTREALSEFLTACYIPALARAPETGARFDDPEDVLYDQGLREMYGRIAVADGSSCRETLTRLQERMVAQEILKSPAHRQVLAAVEASGGTRESYIACLVRNTIRIPTGPNELGLASAPLAPSRKPLTMSDFTGAGAEAWGQLGLGGGESDGAVAKIFKAVGEGVVDFFSYFGRHLSGYALVHHITMFAPAFYGFAVMLVVAVFPLVAIWAILPYKALILVRYFKILAAVKLWPVFWSVTAAFYNSGSLADVVGGRDAGSSALFVAAAMYLVVPVLSVSIVELSSSFGAQPFAWISQSAARAASAGAGVLVTAVLSSAHYAFGAAARQAAAIARPAPGPARFAGPNEGRIQ